MKSYQTYLFDLDGTLITTIDLIYNCFKFSLKKYLGIDFPREDILLQAGLPLKKQFIHFIEKASKNPQDFDLERMAKDHMDYQLKIWKDHVRLYDHALEVVSRLKSDKKKIGIVTSRLMTTTGLYLEHVGLRPYLDCIITPEATEQHKPHPAPVQAALEKMGSDVSTAVMVGDALFDIQSGKAAGMDTIWVVHSDCPWVDSANRTHKTLRNSEPGNLATAIITKLNEL